MTIRRHHTRSSRACGPAFRSSRLVLLLALVCAALAPAAATGQRPDPAAVEAARKLQASRASSEDVAVMLRREHRQSGAQTVAILRAVGYDAEASADGTRSAYRVGFVELSEWMHRAGFEPARTVATLTSRRASLDEVVSGMTRAWAAADVVAGALRRNRIASTAAVRSLARSGIEAESAAEGLARAGYRLDELRSPVRAEYTARTDWLPALTAVMYREGLIDANDPSAMAEEAKGLGLGADEAASWMVDQGVGAVEALVSLVEVGYAASAVGEAAKGHVSSAAEAEELGAALGTAGVVITIVTVIISTVVTVFTFGGGAAVVAGSLLAAGFGGGDVMEAMDQHGFAPPEIVTAMIDEGMATVEIVQSAKDEAIWTAMEMIQALREAQISLTEASSAGVAAGYPPADVSGALLGMGLSASDLEDGLRTVITAAGLGLEEAAALLVDAGAAPATVGAALDGAFADGDERLALYMKLAGMSGEEIAVALHEGAGASVDDIAKILRSQGLAWEEIATALEEGLASTDQAIAAALHHAGMSLQQLTIFLTTVMQLQHDVAMAIIENIG